MTLLAENVYRSYVRLSSLVSPLAPLLLKRRLWKGKEHQTRWRERLGYTEERPSRATIWIHAASVGEAVSVLPLVENAARMGMGILMTTVTATAAAFVADRLPQNAVHQFAPLDLSPVLDRFLDIWNPQLAIFTESEIWPVTIAHLAERAIPMIIVNGRMSVRSFRAWGRFSSIAAPIFERIHLCLTQSDDDAVRFINLGVQRTITTGNMKFDTPIPEAAPDVTANLASFFVDRPIFLAASTHRGEETIMLAVLQRLRLRLPHLLLIIAPRHPERGAEIMEMARAQSLSVARRSLNTLPPRDSAVYIADTIGELGTFYRLATAAFVGGSIVPHGGHNPIEPARLGTAILTGPHTENFAEIYTALLDGNGVSQVKDEADLAESLYTLVTDHETRVRQTTAAKEIAARYTGALKRTWGVVEPLIAPLAIHAQLNQENP